MSTFGMSRTLSRRTLWAPTDEPSTGVAADDPTGARRIRYERLARVSIRHTFYNNNGGRCPDFVVRPTGYTAGLLRTLGMLFKQEDCGFSVLYNELRTPQLLSYLIGRRDARGAWTRLSFLLSLRNPYFINISDLPINTNPALRNFYLSNQQAHEKNGLVLIAPGSRVKGRLRMPVTGGQLVEQVNDTVRRVEVLALSGEMVLCKSRCVPMQVAAAKPPDQLNCDDDVPLPAPRRSRRARATADAPAGEGGSRCTDTLYFDLATLPEDLYTVQQVGYDGAPLDAQKYLYTSLYPMPLCFVNLLFSDPVRGGAGVYPVTLPPGDDPADGAVECVNYTLRFTRRSTLWSYYVVPQAPGGQLSDLRIRQVVDPGEKTATRARFLGPCRVRLAGGQLAWWFLSTRPLPLEQRSRLHLRLTGRNQRMTHTDVLVDQLPVPSGQQVLPITPADACEQAHARLLNPAQPGPRCQRLLDRICGPDPGGRTGNGEYAPPPSFSDIYVYV